MRDAQHYQTLKEALLKRFNLTEEGFKQKFRTAKPELNVAPAQFIARLDSYLMRWIELTGVEQSFDGLRQLMVREQYLETCSIHLAIFLRERKLRDSEDLAQIAEQYQEAHANKTVNKRLDGNQPGQVKIHQSPNKTGSKPGSSGCYVCGKAGHIAKYCNKGRGSMFRSTGQTAAMSTMSLSGFGRGRGSPNRNYGSNTFQGQRGGQRRFQNYQGERFNETQNRATSGMNSSTSQSQNSSDKICCRAHNKEMCDQCFAVSVHRCQAAIHFGGTEAKLECGCILPVVVDACKTNHNRMLVSEGEINGRKAVVMRDTGCSTVVVRKSLVKPEQFTGKDQMCILIDGTVRRTPVAEMEVRTPYYTGIVKASCIENPLYDVIIGNIPGVRHLNGEEANAMIEVQEAGYEKTSVQSDDSDTQILESSEVSVGAGREVVESVVAQGVVTRAQAQQQKKPVKPLRVVDGFNMDVDRSKLIELQKGDQSLRACFDKAENGCQDKFGVTFGLKQGILYRFCKDRTDGREVSQVVLPRELRHRVMKVAHDSLMSGHQGCKKTKDRVWSQFWWPGFSDDVVRYCRSCDICQRTVEKGKIGKVPLGKMPLIETPFERTAVDLIGPIHPPSERGHRYILTVVDYATRYPEAVPLKDIEAETVAEALVGICTRVGLPKEILSDRGSQFMSKVMKEMCRLLSVDQIFTSPYHPMCNGLVEKFNGTLKNMLKKMCSEKPRDWDRYIAALLFAYREVKKQESLCFSPFELIYGRTVRGPISVMKELMTSEKVEPDVKTTYEYVLDLKDRLQETCELAQRELSKAQSKQQKYYNRKAKARSFQIGDKVLVLLPTNLNKLLLQWQGPYEVIEKVRENDYKLQLESRTNVYHANMLKKYYERQNECSDEIQEVSAVELPMEQSSEINELCAVVIEVEDEMDVDMDLYSVSQKATYHDVHICDQLNEEQKQDIQQLLIEFEDIFTDIPGRTTLTEHSILLTTDAPIHCKPYPLPHSMYEVVDAELDSMLKMDIIESSNSPYASPIVLVRKPDGSNRVCVDYRKLNNITIFDPEPMPQTEQIFAKLSKDKSFPHLM